MLPVRLFCEFPTDVQQFFKRFLINGVQYDADPICFVHVISGEDSLHTKIRALEQRPRFYVEDGCRSAAFQSETLPLNFHIQGKPFFVVAVPEHTICLIIFPEEKTIVFGLTGTGYFDLVAYEKFHNGQMDDYVPTDEELAKFRANLPKVR